MTLEDAAEAVAAWLLNQPGTMAPEVFGKETEPEHFRIGIVQRTPILKQRIFELFPLECADCYEVREVAA